MTKKKRVRKVAKATATPETEVVTPEVKTATPKVDKKVKAPVIKETVDKKVIPTGDELKERKAKVNKKTEVAKAKRDNISKPPPFPVEVNGVKNPLLTDKRAKSALVVAMARIETDESVLREMVRNSGIVYKIPNTPEDAPTAELLSRSEWSGNYAKYGIANVKSYSDEDKVKVCMPFAEAVKKNCS